MIRIFSAVSRNGLSARRSILLTDPEYWKEKSGDPTGSTIRAFIVAAFINPSAAIDVVMQGKTIVLEMTDAIEFPLPFVDSSQDRDWLYFGWIFHIECSQAVSILEQGS